jgi:hypothetical protein
MKRVATVQIYDRHLDVCVVARVREYRVGEEKAGRLTLHLVSTLPSVGRDSDQEWLRDALLRLLVDL